jgi:hypothetical protein
MGNGIGIEKKNTPLYCYLNMIMTKRRSKPERKDKSKTCAITSDICWSLNANHRIAACLIDIEKAFDMVWTEAIIYKLIEKKFPIQLIKTIWNMITVTFCNIRFNDYSYFC